MSLDRFLNILIETRSKLTSKIMYVFLVIAFLILFVILGIVLGLTGKYKHVFKEGFETTQPLELSATIKNQLSSVSDSTTHDILAEQLENLQNLLDRYATLDTPIIMNDVGQVCSMWDNYSNGRYQNQQNQCLDIDNTGILKCLDASSTPTTCNNILADGYINNKNKINYQPFLNTTASTIINSIPNITNETNKMHQTIDTIITSLADRGSIQLQQLDIINNNNENMTFKNKIMNDNTKKLSEKQNETNINQNNFSSFMTQITNVDSTVNIYYRIVVGLVIAILIMGLLNFLFSNILS